MKWPGFQIVWAHVISAILGTLGVLTLGIGIVFLLRENTAVAATALVGGLLMVFGSMLDRFELLKGLGLEAKIRDLKRDISNAELLLQKLHEVVSAFAPSLVETVARSGRWSGPPPPRVAYDLVTRLRRIMKEGGTPEPLIRETLQPWAVAAGYEMAGALFDPFLRASHDEYNKRHEARRVDQTLQFADQQTLDTAFAYCEEPGKQAQLLNNAKTWEPRRLADLLEGWVKQLPDWVPPTLAEHLDQDISRWAPELRHLDAQQDIRDPEAWFRRLQERPQ